ncbi:MAG TPA: hypothetical protein VKE26_24625 [Xanthobacteraceae bacterium]|nr:hypothetical protein [Xanthobacteraceae bacterium]
MWKARDAFGALWLRPCGMVICGALAIWSGLGAALAEGSYDDPNTAEGWAWPQIERGEMPDFNERCGTPALDARDEKDPRWREECRRLPARFLQDLLTQPPWRDAIPAGGVQIKGVRIVGDIDLENARLIRSLALLASRIEGAINLVRARTDSLIWFDGTLMDGVFDAEGLHSESDLWLRNGSVFKSDVNLKAAKIDGRVELTGARFDGKLDASQVRIGGILAMNSEGENRASFREVNLIDARVAGPLNLHGASFDGPLNAGLLKVGGTLFAASTAATKTRFRNVFLVGAEIGGNVTLIGADVAGQLVAGLLQVGGSLSMSSDEHNKASFRSVDLTNAKVTGHVAMQGASFDDEVSAGLLQVGGSVGMASRWPNLTNFKKDVTLNQARITGGLDVSGVLFEGKLNADSLKVGGDLFMRYACHADKDVMVFATIGGNLDLRGASLAEADFSGASVAGELRLDGQKIPGCRKGGGGADVLSLRHARVGNLVVADDALPASRRLHLDGFSFGRIGGFEGDTQAQLRGRPMKWWDDWARLDPDYSPTPYAQLAAAFTNSGDRDAANDIRYLDRARQREVACQESWWRGSCLLQTALGAVAGYGIGGHTFIVLPWVLGFWLAGAVLLWGTVPAARHNGAIWCGCASLAQLLPVIPINKELTEFFEDPGRARLKGWQIFTFSALRVIGLALGAILLIAVSGLTHT